MEQMHLDNLRSRSEEREETEDNIKKAMAAGAMGERLSIPRIMRLLKIGFREAEKVFSGLLKLGRVTADGHYIPLDCTRDPE